MIIHKGKEFVKKKISSPGGAPAKKVVAPSPGEVDDDRPILGTGVPPRATTEGVDSYRGLANCLGGDIKPPPPEGLDLSGAWAWWIATLADWRLYCHLTFKEEIHPEEAGKIFNRWVRELNKLCFGKRYRERREGIDWVRGLEYQRREVIHFHALLSSPERRTPRYNIIRDLWLSSGKSAGFMWLEGVRNIGEAARYLGKYVAKGGEIDLCIIPHPKALQRSIWP